MTIQLQGQTLANIKTIVKEKFSPPIKKAKSQIQKMRLAKKSKNSINIKKSSFVMKQKKNLRSKKKASMTNRKTQLIQME